MGITTHIDPPFGAHGLPPARESIRRGGERLQGNRIGKWLISWRRKRAIRGLSEPFDVTVTQGVNARLYPSTNRCEKRALCGVQIWDGVERSALKTAIASSPEASFVFLDVGANVGLYSLFANHYAKQAAKDIRLIAVEPSEEMGARLCVNAAASGADVTLVRCAIAVQAGEVFLSDGGGNRGEGQLAESGESVSAVTLLQLCERQNVTRIDALKLDIEGQDFTVLTQFFEQAPPTLHPQMMILELDVDSAGPLIELVQANNYLMTKRTRMNVVVTKRDQT